ncbi:peptidoglycan-binding domain-containing protein [Alkalinema pantanalense CENA528]|uniref:peptidoglycan-binding domain-containing protein n=1 Tax=Alkalinema pantanalense TaxID=1620705 RepID=UPI003D6E28D3
MAPSKLISLLRNRLAELFTTLNGLLQSSLSGLAYTRLLSLAIGVLILAIGNAAVALQKGDEGDAVADLQNRLTAANCYDGPISGYFGELTQAGVIRCQVQYGLDPDGVAGAQTLAVLGGVASEPPSSTAASSLTPQTSSRQKAATPESRLQIGDQNEAVATLQQQLTQLGYYSSNIDGIFGPKTQAAVQQLQRSSNLPDDGIVGSKEQAALTSAINQQAFTQPTANQIAPEVAPPTPSITTRLAKGDQSSDVGQLQQRLKDLGWFQSNVTEYYGNITQTAVADFQRSQGLPVTGIADAKTLVALNLIASQPTQSTTQTQPIQSHSQTKSPFSSGSFTTASSQTPLTSQLLSSKPVNRQSGIKASNNRVSNDQMRRYVVVIPIQSGATLSQVRQIWNSASQIATNSKGAYIQAGTFSQRSEADRQSQLLRAYGLDARVDYQ